MGIEIDRAPTQSILRRFARKPRPWGPTKEKKEGYIPGLEVLKEVVENIVDRSKTDRSVRERLLFWAQLPQDSDEKFRVETPSPESATIVFGKDKPARRSVTLLVGEASIGFMADDKANTKRIFKWINHGNIHSREQATEALERFVFNDPIDKKDGETVEIVDLSEEEKQRKMEDYRKRGMLGEEEIDNIIAGFKRGSGPPHSLPEKIIDKAKSIKSRILKAFR